MLESALAEAKSGNMRSCAMAWTIDDGSTQPIRKTDFCIAIGHWANLWTALGILERRIANELDGA
jgi:hypothetical protein